MEKVLKILILEDSEDDVVLIERELKKSGMLFDSKVVNSPVDFEDALQGFRPDIILCDHSMPDFNSLEALAAFKTSRNKFPFSPPFILVTGAVSEEFAVQCIKAGADDYIMKDRLKRLPASIEKALEKTRIDRERKEYLSTIISNEAMMKEAEHLAKLGSWQADLLTGMLKWSDETYRIYGYAPGETEPSYEKFLSHVHPDDIESVKVHLDSALAGMGSHDCEFRIIDHRGTVKFLYAKMLLRRNDQGTPVHILGFNLDVTDKKAADASMRKHLKRLEEQNGGLSEIQARDLQEPVARIVGLIGQLGDFGGQSEMLKHALASAHDLDAALKRIISNTREMRGKDHPGQP